MLAALRESRADEGHKERVKSFVGLFRGHLARVNSITPKMPLVYLWQRWGVGMERIVYLANARL
ncbi:MAG: hypothetical protein IMHGJWDQ_001868, partial [Candidatus Fervidibacter sp.]